MAFHFDAIGFPLRENGPPPRLTQIGVRNLRPPSLSLNFPACAAATRAALPSGAAREIQFHRPQIARTTLENPPPSMSASNPILAARPTCE